MRAWNGRRWRGTTREQVVEASKWHVSVDCGQYRRRTSEGRPTFFPSEHRQIDIYSRAAVPTFSCCCCSSSLDRRVTDTPAVSLSDETASPALPVTSLPRFSAARWSSRDPCVPGSISSKQESKERWIEKWEIFQWLTVVLLFWRGRRKGFRLKDKELSGVLQSY